MSPNSAKCRICRKNTETKSLYEKVRVTEKNIIKYLPQIIENISGVKITAANDPRATICIECTDNILQAEDIINKCREIDEKCKEIAEKANAGSSESETNEEDNIEKELDWNYEGKKVKLNAETMLLEECVENYTEPEMEMDLKISKKNEQLVEEVQQELSETKQKRKKQVKFKDLEQADKDETINKRKLRTCRKNKVNDKESVESEELHQTLLNEIYRSSGNDHNNDDDVPNKRNSTTTPPSHHKSNNPSNKSSRKYIRTVNKNKDYFFRCDQCSYTSKFATHFRAHMQQTHSIPQPRIFKCPQCIKDFREYRYLQQHIAHDHQNLPTHYKYLCSECGRCFAKSCNLKYHQRTHLPVHQRTQVPLVSCEFCSKKYSQHSIRMHILTIHAEERNYACSLCHAAFAVAKGLQAHMRTCHPAEILRCPCCEVKFRVKSVYESHVKRGGCQKLGFNCDFCAWGFKTRERLEKHRLNVHKNVLHLQ